MKKRVIPSIIAVFLLVGSLSASAQAGTIYSNATIVAGWEGDLQELAPGSHGEWNEGPDGQIDWSWDSSSPWIRDDLEITSFNLFLDPDPGIASAGSVKNAGGVTQTFVIEVTLPVAMTVPAGGSMTGGTSISIADTDFDGDGAMGTSGADPIYKAFIDGVLQKTLFNSPYSLSFAAQIPGFTTGDTSNFSDFSTEALDSTLKLRHEFEVSPGDTATFNGTFFVIPEPATMSLLGLGGLALLRRKRRA